MEHFRVKRESFPGLSCTWYSHVVGPAEQPGGRFLHCATSNRSTLAGNNLKVLKGNLKMIMLPLIGFTIGKTFTFNYYYYYLRMATHHVRMDFIY